MEPTLDQRVERLQAMVYLLTGECMAACDLLRKLSVQIAANQPEPSEHVPPTPADLAAGAAFDKEYARKRRRSVQLQLEMLQHTQPGLAAAIQDLLDRSCTNLPVDYQDEDVE